MDSNLVTFEDVAVRYNGNTLLDNICFTLKKGSSTALLGPNGSGKTTSIRCLTGVLLPSSGSVLCLGKNLCSLAERSRAKLRRVIGIQSDSNPYLSLTVSENIVFRARIYGQRTERAYRTAESLIEMLALQHYRDKQVNTLSKGMKQRVSLAAALAGDPRLLVLDEPTSGLDPQASKDLMNYINSRRLHEGTTVLLSSHRLPGLDDFASHAVFIRNGRSILSGSVEELENESKGSRSAYLKFVSHEKANEANELLRSCTELLASAITVSDVDHNGNELVVGYSDQSILGTINMIASRGGGLISSDIDPFTLSGLYFDVMGGRADDSHQ